MLTSCSNRILCHDPGASWVQRLSSTGYDELIRDLSWCDEGKYLLQVNPRGLVEVLSCVNNEIKSLQCVPLRETWAACFHRDGHRHIAIGAKSGQVSIWDTKYKNVVKVFPLPSQATSVNILSYNAKNTNLAATMHNGDTIIYGTTSNSAVLTVRVQRSKSISAMKFHHESRSLLGLATDEGDVVIKDITMNKDKAFFKKTHASPVSDFAYSPINRDVMLSCSYDRIVRFYDVRNENVVSNIETNHPLTSVAMNIENIVALGTRKGPILVYDLRNLDTPLTVIDDHNDEIRRVGFQPRRTSIERPTELSLKEITAQMSPKHSQSPVPARTPDLFLVSDTPSPKTAAEKSKTDPNIANDSFLFKLGLDKSTSNESFAVKKSVDLILERRQHIPDSNTKIWENNAVAKASTPVTSRITEKLPPPSSYSTPKNESLKTLVEETPLDAALPSPDQGQDVQVNGEITRELGEIIKVSVAELRSQVFELAWDSRISYLNLLGQHTKQHLYFENNIEKKMAAMMIQMQAMQKNLDSLTEENRKLVMEVNFLKNQSSNNKWNI